MMKKGMLIILAVMLFGLVGKAQCGWKNGQDSSNPSDPGRGITNWQDHYNWGKNAGDLSPSLNFVKVRLNALLNCMNNNQYAKLYADLSMKIADYGINYSNWTNSGNNTLTNDGGCGLKDWNAHNNWAKTNGANAPGLVRNRLAALLNEISRDNYARLYADVSVIIAKYGAEN
jgi:hypothetical protein